MATSDIPGGAAGFSPFSNQIQINMLSRDLLRSYLILAQLD